MNSYSINNTMFLRAYKTKRNNKLTTFALILLALAPSISAVCDPDIDSLQQNPACNFALD